MSDWTGRWNQGVPPAGYPSTPGGMGSATPSGSHSGAVGKHGKYKPNKASAVGLGIAGGAAAGLGTAYVAHKIGKGFGKFGKGFGKMGKGFGKFGKGFGKFGKFGKF